MNEAFLTQQDSNRYATPIMLAVVLTAIGLAIGIYAYCKRPLRSFSHPGKLFREMCQAHGMSRRQRLLLAELAHARDVADPNLVLLDSTYWVLEPQRDKKLCEARTRGRLLALQRMLFPNGSSAQK